MPPSICVMGLGYIGLPTASLLGSRGYKVHGVDVNPSVVNNINAGEIHIKEPDLDIMLRSAVASGQLTASLTPVEADVFIIAVPTPFKDEKQPDLSYIITATKALSSVVKPGDLVILESTSPLGTTEKIASILNEHCEDIYIAHCPERVLPGKILLELVENDRIIGGVDEASTKKAVEFYQGFVNGKILETNAKTAELSKLTENSFRDVNIAFANELSMICEKHQIDTWELIELANHHPRVNILQPGPGVGGHCIAVDPWFIVASSPDQSRLIRTAREVNDSKPEWVIDKVLEKAQRYKAPIIACLGLAFKADIDDLRESPAVYIANQLQEKAPGTVLAVEPNIPAHDVFELCSLEHALTQADIIVLLVDHKEFKELPAPMLQEKAIIDTRGCISI